MRYLLIVSKVLPAGVFYGLTLNHTPNKPKTPDKLKLTNFHSLLQTLSIVLLATLAILIMGCKFI